MPVVLYERQRQTLDFIIQYIQKHGYSPTLKEIADYMGLHSLATVHEHVKSLIKKGVLRKKGRGKERSLEIVDEDIKRAGKGIELPILGFISEGSEIEPYSRGNAFLGVPPQMASGENRHFILEAKNDSLAAEGILKGDLLVIEETADVKDQDVVVALLESKAVAVKRFFKETTRVKLEWLRADQPPIYTNKVQIQGKLKGIIRNY